MVNEDEWQGDYQGSRKRCEDCRHFNGVKHSGNFASCSILSKINKNIETHSTNNICSQFEYEDYLKFRITDKIDSLTGEWSYDDYLDFLKNEWYVDSTPKYMEYDKNIQYLPTLGNGHQKWVVMKNGWAVKVQHVHKDPITMSLNYVKLNSKKYYIDFHDFMDLSFINDDEIKYAGYVEETGIKRKKYKGAYEYAKDKIHK